MTQVQNTPRFTEQYVWSQILDAPAGSAGASTVTEIGAADYTRIAAELNALAQSTPSGVDELPPAGHQALVDYQALYAKLATHDGELTTEMQATVDAFESFFSDLSLSAIGNSQHLTALKSLMMAQTPEEQERYRALFEGLLQTGDAPQSDAERRAELARLSVLMFSELREFGINKSEADTQLSIQIQQDAAEKDREAGEKERQASELQGGQAIAGGVAQVGGGVGAGYQTQQAGRFEATVKTLTPQNGEGALARSAAATHSQHRAEALSGLAAASGRGSEALMNGSGSMTAGVEKQAAAEASADSKVLSAAASAIEQRRKVTDENITGTAAEAARQTIETLRAINQEEAQTKTAIANRIA